MTGFEYYRGKPTELASKIEKIQNACNKCGLDFSEMLEDFLNSKHFGIESEKVDRELDGTFVVNVGFVYNTQSKISDSAPNFEEYKEMIEQSVGDIVRAGIQTVLLTQKTFEPSDSNESTIIPNNCTNTGTQFFQFQNDEFLERMM